jgi:hypothetical protein
MALVRPLGREVVELVREEEEVEWKVTEAEEGGVEHGAEADKMGIEKEEDRVRPLLAELLT